MSATFSDLGVGEPFLQTLTRLGYETATPVQVRALPVLLAGNDLIACAPTGTGKTAAFLLPALQRVATQPGARGRGPRVLVLAPTRELAAQVAKAAQDLSQGLRQVSTVCVTGGESYQRQNRQLAAPHELLVATPGRLMDQLRSGRVSLERVDVLVLDEADRMLDMGFADDVMEIARHLPKQRQTVCFTATLSQSVRELADRLLRDPQWLEIERAARDAQPIDQHVIYSDGLDHKLQLLDACLADEGLGQAIVFTSTKRDAEQLADRLHNDGHAVGALHGDLTQRERARAVKHLRAGEWRVLVATDVAARGLDISSITHVINFDLPRHAEDYVHRVGRTGRAGASGQALSFVGRQDVFAVRRIEQFIGQPIQVSKIDGLEARFQPGARPAGRPGAPRRRNHHDARGHEGRAHHDARRHDGRGGYGGKAGAKAGGPAHDGRGHDHRGQGGHHGYEARGSHDARGPEGRRPGEGRGFDGPARGPRPHAQAPHGARPGPRSGTPAGRPSWRDRRD